MLKNMLPTLLDISNLQGVGPTIRKSIINLCGGNRVIDLIFHMPIQIQMRKLVNSPLSCKEGDIVIIKGKVSSCQIPAQKSRPCRISIKSSTDEEFIINFFRYSIPYIKQTFQYNSKVVISGQISKFATITHPEYVSKEQKFDTQLKEFIPIYPLTKGVNNKLIIKIMNQALKLLTDFKEWVPDEALIENNWKSWKNSLIAIHQPENNESFENARRRLAYDELLINQIKLLKLRNNQKQGKSISSNNELSKKTLQKLPFKLTQGQCSALQEIYKDQAENKIMYRLLQGDVGSGKTIVALLAMLNAVECGFQAALMAPTEMLAKQHYEWISSQTDLKANILSRNNKKKTTIESIANGDTKIIIGTHALFQEKIQFNNLGLIVIDEQHRFGVKQRYQLSQKGLEADILLMSATPIPRSLALTSYGDMDISIIPDKPLNRKNITTSIISDKNIDAIISRIIKNKSKAYWICPAIEESDYLKISAVESRYNYILHNHSNDHNYPIYIVHGRMTEDQKDNVINTFRNNNKGLLVSTTVIEVGIDIPDAHIMIIENSERFGLAQLHQLRGRVGRGEISSFCILIYSGSNCPNRLKVIKDSEDGFYIAEQDLKIRGSGDITGIRQSGWNQFKFARINIDKDLLIFARKQALKVIKEKNSLRNINVLEKMILPHEVSVV